jgi:hypothetical protein
MLRPYMFYGAERRVNRCDMSGADAKGALKRRHYNCLLFESWRVGSRDS